MVCWLLVPSIGKRVHRKWCAGAPWALGMLQFKSAIALFVHSRIFQASLNSKSCRCTVWLFMLLFWSRPLSKCRCKFFFCVKFPVKCDSVEAGRRHTNKKPHLIPTLNIIKRKDSAHRIWRLNVLFFLFTTIYSALVQVYHVMTEPSLILTQGCTSSRHTLPSAITR